MCNIKKNVSWFTSIAYKQFDLHNELLQLNIRSDLQDKCIKQEIFNIRKHIHTVGHVLRELDITYWL